MNDEYFTGIGLGIVKEYINKGFRVIATCRKPDKATELSEILAKNGQRSPLELDTSSLVSVQACKENLLKEISALDVLVNNAGISNKDHPVSLWKDNSKFYILKSRIPLSVMYADNEIGLNLPFLASPF